MADGKAGYPQQYPPVNPPPPTYMAGAQQPGVVIHMSNKLGEESAEVECPNCHAHIRTETRYENGLLVWIIFAACFGFGFLLLVPWCLCWIPFVVDGCKDVHHYCPNCKHLIAKFNRIG